MRDTKFDEALDEAFDRKNAEQGRPPNTDETNELRDRLMLDGIKAERFDDLIDHALDTFELEGGFGFCASVSEALRKKNDLSRIERLFRGLVSSRSAAFWKAWPKAQEGHIGAMRESARHMSSAMEAMAGLWHGYWSLKDEAGMRETQEAMTTLQARVKTKLPKPKASK